MRNRKIYLLLFVCLSALQSFAQKPQSFGGPITSVGYEKLGAVRGTAGVINDNYYVIENDYGGKFDMNNNIKTSVAIFSTQNGRLKKRISLNEMVANTNREVNKILFSEIVTWKDKLIGVYIHKANAKTFMANAVVCDADGKLIKDLEIGEFSYNYEGPAGGMLNARKKLSAVKHFQMRFSADSSRLIMLASAPDNKSSNVRFRVFKPGLEFEKEVVAALPLDKKEGELINFVCDTKGMIYVLGQTERSNTEKKESDRGKYNHFLYAINTTKNNEVKALSFYLPEKAILTANVSLMANDAPICVGFYNNPEVKKSDDQSHGMFSMAVDPANFTKPAMSTKAIPDSIIVKFKSEKALKKGQGIDEVIQIVRFDPKPDGSLFAFGRYDYVQVTQHGSTGAMNTYREVLGAYALIYIDKSGKIQWEKISQSGWTNKELSTRLDCRTTYIASSNQAKFYYCASPNEITGLYSYTADATGESKDSNLHVKIPDIKWYNIVENSLTAIGTNEYVCLVYAEGGKKNGDQIAIVRFTHS